MVLRTYVEKKCTFDLEAQKLWDDIEDLLEIKNIDGVRIVNRYDVEGISKEVFESCIPQVFAEPQTDTFTDELPVSVGAHIIAVEAMPGQFDQRASSAAECIQFITHGTKPIVKCAKLYMIFGVDDPAAQEKIKNYVLNPVESRIASMDLPETLAAEYPKPEPVARIAGFCNFTKEEVEACISEYGLAMDLADMKFCQDYFACEKRDPSVTEIKMIDTYWSDHCRHTTFATILNDENIANDQVRDAFNRYKKLREDLGRANKPLCLMDMATIGARYLKHEGILNNLDESDEINACTVKIKCDVNGNQEDWLYLFKNETHNHPTEIEPFGGAATCVGGAIRDPLSGRSYVYQAMRVTGAADPRTPISQTLPGKLPQRKIVTEAAHGYSSYGNQIGLATGMVDEIYHPGYVAKRMEIGAVVGAAPAKNVRRENPSDGDVIILLGGHTGRDGVGGATGSSKAHSSESLETCGAEVQKGNAPVERKIQRLFRREEVCVLIKKCNDFGAGGVSVAVGELAGGLEINLDAVPKKYEGLDGTELALSESQERMAVAVSAKDADAFIEFAQQENLDAVIIAKVTELQRVKMNWQGDCIVDLSREFLDSNGADKFVNFEVVEAATYGPEQFSATWTGNSAQARFESLAGDLNVASKKGLIEHFDSTIGAGTVLMPLGGRRQLSSAQAMVAKLPVLGETTTCSAMSWGFNPYISSANQYVGAYLAVVESVAKLVATGFSRNATYLTLQEYFERLGTDASRWGKPVSAVLGALDAQMDLQVGAIGGKDSMSGSFEDIDVPPSLISFATAIGHVDDVVSTEFKEAGSQLVCISPEYTRDCLVPEAASMRNLFDGVAKVIHAGKVLSASTPAYGGMAAALMNMARGNMIGVHFADGACADELFLPAYGSFILEVSAGEDVRELLNFEKCNTRILGETTKAYEFAFANESVCLESLERPWASALADIFPYEQRGAEGAQVTEISYSETLPLTYSKKAGKPSVLIPVFPGTNCEYDTARAFELAGAIPEIVVVKNITPALLEQSMAQVESAIRRSEIVMLPGGFSGGDEPDGSAKFITSYFRNPALTDAIRDLLQVRDGLMLGICNGFQALIKLGLVPYGDIVQVHKDSPTLTFNTISRHQSGLVRTRIASTMSPWLSLCQVGDVHTIPISHGEGRFVCSQAMLDDMEAKGQIATQYVDENGVPSMSLGVNPNGSVLAVESISSPDGRVLGKMGHSERFGYGLYKNVPGNHNQPLFEGGINYFKG